MAQRTWAGRLGIAALLIVSLSAGLGSASTGRAVAAGAHRLDRAGMARVESDGLTVAARIAPASDLTFTVNSTADAPDANPGDGICADSSGQCTLRAAIQEADAQPSGSNLAINVPAGTYGLTLGTLQLTANSITISGALSSTTIISGNNTSTVMSISSTVQARISQLTIAGGRARPKQGGGGILNAGRTVLNQSRISSNTATNGGGIFNGKGGRLSLIGSTLSDNLATYDAGGIYNQGTLSMTISTLSSNSANANGGGIFNRGTLSVTNSTLSSGLAGAGGGIWNDLGGALSVTNSILKGNQGLSAGGGIVNNGTLSVATSTLSGNSANSGGGIYSYQGTVTVATSTFGGNSTNPGGGGGGAIYNYLGMLNVTTSTFSSNTASVGGGDIDNSSGTVALTGSIVANSMGGPNCSGPLTDHGYNLDSGTSCGFSQSTDITNTNPLLGPLANNGGPTQTMALLPGSPAIDEGGTHATGCPTTDQRGMPRPDEAKDKGACDMGAYESQGVG